MAAFLFDPQFWLTPKILSSVIGASLLLMGITGGDFSVTSVKIPKIEGVWRLTSAVASVLFLLFGFGLLDGVLKSASSGTATSSVSTPTGTPTNTSPDTRSTLGEPKPPLHQTDAGASASTVPSTPSTATAATGTGAGTAPPATVTPSVAPTAPPTATVQISVSDSLGNDQMWETVDLRLGSYPQQRLSVTRDRRKSLVSFSVPAKGELSYQIDQTQMRLADGQTVHDSGTGTINPENSQSFVVDGGIFNGQHRIFLRPATH